MAFELPPLPWAEDALEPAYSARTVSFHYGKHHKAYVDKLNELVAGTPYADMTLEDVVKDTAGKADKAGVFNNAAQIWNHTSFWASMKPGGGGKPTGELAVMIDQTWGGFDKFVEAFVAAAVGRFGSGWAWLVVDDGEFKIVTTPNAETPLTTGAKALLTVDVWEHAYYLDYQNLRPKYVQTFFDSLANWDEALVRWCASDWP
jgi:Fe-Mn family superoxide dismutase